MKKEKKVYDLSLDEDTYNMLIEVLDTATAMLEGACEDTEVECRFAKKFSKRLQRARGRKQEYSSKDIVIGNKVNEIGDSIL